MSTVPVTTDFVASQTAAQALPANSARNYLQIQNQSADVITYKFGGPFAVPASAVQKVSFNRVPDGGNWQLSFGDQTTTPLAFNANAAAVQTAFQALSTVGANNATVAGDYTVGFTITFAAGLALLPQPLVGVVSNLTDSTAAINAVQSITFSTPPTAGAWVLSFNGEQTAPLDAAITAANLKIALNLLGGIAGGVSAVTQDGTTKNFSVTFGALPLSGAAQPLLVLVSSTLTGNAAVASQVQKLYSAPAPISGTFQLSNGGHTTTALAYNANAAAIQAALEALPSIGTGNVAVTGSGLVDGFTITYQGTLANSVVANLFVINKLLQSDTLSYDDVADGLDEIDPDDVRLSMPITTPGHGLDTVAVSFATTVPGGGPAAVTVSAVTVSAGAAPFADGVDLPVAGGQLWDSEVPISSLWIKSAGGSSAVTILEG